MLQKKGWPDLKPAIPSFYSFRSDEATSDFTGEPTRILKFLRTLAEKFRRLTLSV